MGGLFGGGGSQNINNTEPMALGLRVQTSAYGLVQPVVYGKTRLTGNLIWYGAFTAIPHTTTSSSGGGGGKGGGGQPSYSNTTYTYTASFAFGLCEGVISDIGAIWADKNYYTTNSTFTVFTGGSQLVDQTFPMTISGNVATNTRTVDNGFVQLNWTPAYNGGSETYSVQIQRSLNGGAWVTVDTATFSYVPGAWAYGYDGDGNYYQYWDSGSSNTQFSKNYTGLSNGVYSWRFVSGSGTGAVAFGNCSVVDHVPIGSTQSAWPYLVSNFPSQALAYRGVAYAAVPNYDLGSSTSIPNFSFEVIGCLSQYGNGDANPSDALYNFLTDSSYGAGFSANKIADWTAFNNYCLAQNIILSPIFDSQAAASEAVTTLMQITNCGVYFSEGLLKITPYGDEQKTANGVTYFPNNIPVYEIGDSDYIVSGSDDPVLVRRVPQADAYNQIQIEFVNRSNQYNVQIAEAKDQANIEAYGLRPKDPIRAHHITEPEVAQTVAQLILQRTLYIRNVYKFRVSAKFALLEPTDYITITDSTLGLNQKPVRITSIEEDSDYSYLIEAEDAPAGVRNAAQYPTEPADGHQNQYNVAPGNTNSPVIFEAPDTLTVTGLEVWVAASGGESWGGCQVWVSYDGNSYQQVGVISNPSRMGFLSAALASGTDPDTTHTLSVDLTTSRGSLSSGTQQDADQYATVCYVDGELISYETATLTSQYHYNLNYLRRGAYGTTIGSHATNSQFVRLDASVFKYAFTNDQIGQTVYIKLPAYNIYSTGLQALSDVGAYQYTIQGSALFSPLPDVQNVVSNYNNFVGGLTTIYWDAISDFRQPAIDYEIRVGDTWENGKVVAQTAVTRFVVPSNGQYWVSARYVNNGKSVYSATASPIYVAESTLQNNVIATYNEAPSWSGTKTTGLVVNGSGYLAFSVSGGLTSVTSGTYTLPSGHAVNIGRVSPCNVLMNYTVNGRGANENILTVANVFDITDLLDVTLGPAIALTPQIAIAGSDGVYGAWQNFVPGYYNAQYFKARFMVATNDSTVNVEVADFVFSVDVPDRMDTGTVAVPSGGTTVTYTSPFNGGANGATIPTVQTTIVSASAGDTAVLTSQTVNGFSIQVLNSSGAGVARSVNWVAQGY